jgi:hypothetical protein
LMLSIYSLLIFLNLGGTISIHIPGRVSVSQGSYHRIKISNRRATQQCNMSSFFYAKICSLLARRRSSQPVQCVYWPENVIDWLGKWRPTCVMRHARGQKLQSFRRKWPFYMDLYSMVRTKLESPCQWMELTLPVRAGEHVSNVRNFDT